MKKDEEQRAEPEITTNNTTDQYYIPQYYIPVNSLWNESTITINSDNISNNYLPNGFSSGTISVSPTDPNQNIESRIHDLIFSKDTVSPVEEQEPKKTRDILNETEEYIERLKKTNGISQASIDKLRRDALREAQKITSSKPGSRRTAKMLVPNEEDSNIPAPKPQKSGSYDKIENISAQSKLSDTTIRGKWDPLLRLLIDQYGRSTTEQFLDEIFEERVPKTLPINEDEETIVITDELADTLAKNEITLIKGEGWNEDENIELLAKLITKYRDLIIRHKRKVYDE